MVKNTEHHVTVEPLMRYQPNGPEHKLHVTDHPDWFWGVGPHFTIYKESARRKVLEFELSWERAQEICDFLSEALERHNQPDRVVGQYDPKYGYWTGTGWMDADLWEASDRKQGSDA